MKKQTRDSGLLNHRLGPLGDSLSGQHKPLPHDQVESVFRMKERIVHLAHNISRPKSSSLDNLACCLPIEQKHYLIHAPTHSHTHGYLIHTTTHSHTHGYPFLQVPTLSRYGLLAEGLKERFRVVSLFFFFFFCRLNLVPP